MHPYELGRSLREHGDARRIKFNHGSLYMVVGQLARASFVEQFIGNITDPQSGWGPEWSQFHSQTWPPKKET